MIATFPSTCRKCRKLISIGEPIARIEKALVHSRCANPVQPTTIKIKASTYYGKPTPKGSVGIEWPKSSNCHMTVSSETALIAPEGLSYLPYQDEGIRYVCNHHNTLLADEMGLGKTVQAIGALNQLPDIRSVLIVTPASLRYNWRAELSRWLSRYLIPCLYPESDNGDIWIASFESMNLITERQSFDLLIIDEAHGIKNPEAKRTKNARRLANRIKRKWLLSGSPIENAPRELFTLLSILDPTFWDPAGFYEGKPVNVGNFGGMAAYQSRYCDPQKKTFWRTIGKRRFPKTVHTYDGASNLEELNQRLKESCMIRRLKRDVLKDLPPKRRQVIVLPPPEDISVIEREHKTFVEAGFDYEMDIELLGKKAILFEEIAKARHETSLAKVPAVVDHIDSCFENGVKKIVLFAHHKDVVWQLADKLDHHGVVILTGDYDERMRDISVREFQHNENVKLFIGSLKAAGVGLTLTASSHVVFAEMDWKPMEQAEDRVHRIGQEESVLIQYLVFDWSVDSNMIKKVLRKMEIAEEALNR